MSTDDQLDREVDRTSLTAGIIFVALGALFLADQWVTWDIEARWVWPLLLILVGVLGLATGTRRNR